MECNVRNEDAKIAPELYFLIAKFLSAGPLRDTAEVLRRELERCKILPARLDWQGNSHEQSFEDLEKQFPSIDPHHLLRACASLIKPSRPEDPKRSLLAASLGDKEWRSRPRLHPKNIICRLRGRELSGGGAASCPGLIPSELFCGLRLQRRTLGHLSAVYCVLYDRTGKYIMTGADDLLVKVWSAIDGRLLGTFRGASAEITDMAVDVDNTMLAAGSLDRLIRVWDLQTQAPLAVLQGHSGMITSVHFCPARAGDLHCLASTSTDGSVAFWTYSQNDDTKASFISKPVQYVERMRPGACQMICGAWSSGGTFFASGSADHHVRIYMMAEQGPKRIVEVAAHHDAVDSLQWAHAGLKFVSGSKDGTAILWQLSATQWRHTILHMTATLPGESTGNEEAKKLKVTMVAWDCLDNHIITADNDRTLKVWSSNNGQLLRILSGHKDEIYVLESHPSLPQILLSAGHDGQMFIWDIDEGVTLCSFLNDIEGQGHGAVFDAKWAPDGASIAATDSHGHILMLGMGQGHPRLQTLPFELFFHTDYRPLVRDALGGVCDEQTGAPPHLMPPPFLVDVEGRPPTRPPCSASCPGGSAPTWTSSCPTQVRPLSYRASRPSLRRPFGRRLNCYYSSDRRSGLRFGAGVAHRRHDRGAGAAAGAGGGRGGGPGPGGGRRALGPRGRAARARPTGSRGAPLCACRRPLLPPLPPPRALAARRAVAELTQSEMNRYRYEMRRRPLMISTGASGGAAGGRAAARRGAGPPGRRSGPRERRGARPAPAPRPPGPHSDREDVPDALTPPISVESDTSPISADEYSASSTTTEQSDDNSSDSSSSAYSDWKGPDLEPPKRSKRRPVARKTYSPQVPPARKTPTQPTVNGTSSSQSSAVAGPSTSTSATASTFRGSSQSPSKEIPEEYRISEWLCAVVPRKTPYHPQMGDECIYFKQGHARYLEAVSEKDEYKVSSKDKPWERCKINDCETVKVVGIKYLIRPPRLVCLKLAIMDPHSTNILSGRTFTVKYHDMADVLDFLVLRQSYETAIERQWSVNDRFRCMIDDCWWMGVVMAVEESTSGPRSSRRVIPQAHHLLSLRVRWDNGEHERLSPWDLEPVDEDRLPSAVGGSVGVLPSEAERMLYLPRAEEWGAASGSCSGATARSRRCEGIARAMGDVMSLAIAEPFVAPVDLARYPNYAFVVEYPIDLSTIKARFQNRFYRRLASAQFDVRYLATNAEKFNDHHSHIVKQARIITDLCLQIISAPGPSVDVGAAYRRLVDSYHSSDSDVPIVKPSGTRSRGGSSWRATCKTVLEELWRSQDSHPFREPVDLNTAPDYLQIVDVPMDLGTVRDRLFAPDYYKSPEEFVTDVRLIFSNSKHYNTNKRSRIYSMTLRLCTLFDALVKPVIYNWKAARRRSSDGSRSRRADRPSRKKHIKNGYSHVDVEAGSDDEFLSSLRMNGDRDASSDSDRPLVCNGKGKGKGKRTRISSSPGDSQPSTSVAFQPSSSHLPTPCKRASLRTKTTASRNTSSDSRTECEDFQTLDENLFDLEQFFNSIRDARHQNDTAKETVETSSESDDAKNSSIGTSDDLYTPRQSRSGDRHNSKRRKTKRKARRKGGGGIGRASAVRRNTWAARDSDDEDFTLNRRRKANNSHSHQLNPRKRRKLNRSRDTSADSSEDSQDAQNDPLERSQRSRRYESDHSYKGKSTTDDDDLPLGSMQASSSSRTRAINGTRENGGEARNRRSGGTRPKYNEDSEEDSIAAIGKRLRANQVTSVPTSSNRGRMQVGGVRDGPGVMSPPSGVLRAHSSSISNSRPSTSSHTDHSYYNGNADFNEEAEDNDPLLISSRGRIRKLTAKARNLLRE